MLRCKTCDLEVDTPPRGSHQLNISRVSMWLFPDGTTHHLFLIPMKPVRTSNGRGNHVRFHERRNIKKEGCSFCESDEQTKGEQKCNATQE